MSDKLKFKTVWISDLHLGSRGCQAQAILDFLSSIKFDSLVLNGDIIDGWRLKSKWFFPQLHANVIRKFFSIAKHEKEVIYVSGNHDEFLREFHEFDIQIGNIKVVNKYVYKSPISGLEFLVVHGDGFDAIVKYHKWLAFLGDIGYNLLLNLNRTINTVSNFFGTRKYSLSKYVKHKVKEAANFIFAFEETATRVAKDKGYDGIICGHIHHPDLKLIDSETIYMNSGDFVETCSWIGERLDGTLEIWEWNDGEPLLLKSYNPFTKELMIYPNV